MNTENDVPRGMYHQNLNYEQKIVTDPSKSAINRAQKSINQSLESKVANSPPQNTFKPLNPKTSTNIVQTIANISQNLHPVMQQINPPSPLIAKNQTFSFNPSMQVNSVPTLPISSNLTLEEQSKIFKLIAPSSDELLAINKSLSRDPEFFEKFEVRSIEKLENATVRGQYESKMKWLALKKLNSELYPSFMEEKLELENRKKIQTILKEEKSSAHGDSGVYEIDGFHAIPSSILAFLLLTGPIALSKTDKGFFSRGTYFSTFASYVAKIYGKPDDDGVIVILMCKICYFHDLFPVVPSDELLGAAIKEKYEGHYILVKSKYPDLPHNKIYIAADPDDYTYDEIVMGDPAHTSIEYVIKVVRNESYIPQLKKKFKGQDLQDVITKYMHHNPLDDLFSVLNQKLNEIRAALGEALSEEQNKLREVLFNVLEERDAQKKINLKAKVNELLKTKSLPKQVIISAPQKAPEKPTEALTKANLDFQNKKYKIAINKYEAIIKKTPSYLAHLWCGNACFELMECNETKASHKQRYLNEAISHFKSAMKIDLKNPDACLMYAKSLTKRAQNFGKEYKYSEAIRDLEEAINYDSCSVSALTVSANINFHRERFDLAFTNSVRALALQPDYPTALMVRGACFMQKGNEYYDKALEDLTLSIQLFPHSFAYTHRANLYISIQYFEEARNDCLEILKKDSDNFEALSLLAKIFLLQENIKSADIALNNCEKKYAKDPLILSLRGEWFIQNHEVNKALECFNKCAAYYDNKENLSENEKVHFYEVLLSRAEGYHLLKNNKKANDYALENFSKAIKLDPENPRAYIKRRNFHQERGNHDQAKADYSKALYLTESND